MSLTPKKDWKLEKDEVVLEASFRNPALFEILLDRYEEAFLRKACGIVRTQEEAEDIVQETFVKIYRFGKSFEKQPGIEFKSWAYKILMNTGLTHYAKLKKTGNVTEYLDYLDPDKNNIKEHSVDLGLRHDIEKALSKMPSTFADPIKSYFFEGKSYKDIAKEQKISLSALKMRLFRAKKMFKNIF